MSALLVFHALAAIVAVGVATHLAVVSFRIWRGARHLGRLVPIYATTLAVAFGAAFALGVWLYPHYRLHTRAAFLDPHAPWASNLFDVKENLAALALPLVALLCAVGRRFRLPEDARLAPLLAGISASVGASVVVALVSGLVVTNVKGV